MKRGKKGQLQISFNMIFSVILIIAFVAVAIYAIIMFLEIKKCADTGLFKEDLQNEINRAWSSEEASFSFKGNLPSQIQKVCFINLPEGKKGMHTEEYTEFKKYGYQGGMFFYPLKKACEGQRVFKLEHINITEITKSNNPNCFENNGKVELKIEKSFYDALVKIN